MKKTIGIIALLAAMVMLLTACGGNKIEGSWRYTDGTGEGAELFNQVQVMGSSIVFTFKDGKMTVEAEGLEGSLESDYKTDGKKITITSEGSVTEGEFKVDGKKLTLTLEGTTLNFEKK